MHDALRKNTELEKNLSDTDRKLKKKHFQKGRIEDKHEKLNRQLAACKSEILQLKAQNNELEGNFLERAQQHNIDKKKIENLRSKFNEKKETWKSSKRALEFERDDL